MTLESLDELLSLAHRLEPTQTRAFQELSAAKQRNLRNMAMLRAELAFLGNPCVPDSRTPPAGMSGETVMVLQRKERRWLMTMLTLGLRGYYSVRAINVVIRNAAAAPRLKEYLENEIQLNSRQPVSVTLGELLHVWSLSRPDQPVYIWEVRSVPTREQTIASPQGGRMHITQLDFFVSLFVERVVPADEQPKQKQ